MKFKATLRLRLVLLMLAAVLPLFALSLVTSMLNTDAAIKRATLNLQAVAALVAGNQQQLAETAKQVLTAIANSPDVFDANVARCTSYLANLNRLYPAYANLGIIGADGNTRCHGIDAKGSVYLGDRTYFRDALASRSFASGDYVLGRLSARPVINFALPTLDADGRVNQIAYLAIDVAEISASIAKTNLPPTGRVVILDRNGAVLAAKPSVSTLIGSKLPNPIVQDVVKTMSVGVREGRDAAGSERIFAFQPSGPAADSPFFVVLSIERAAVVAMAHRERNVELSVLAGVALMGAAFAWVLGGRMIVRPTAEILQASQQVQQGQFDVRISPQRLGNGSEFAQIADGINGMADALQQREAELKKELVKSQSAQRKLVDAQRMGRLGHAELNMATQHIELSDEVSALFGLEPGSFDGHVETLLQMFHPDDQVRFRLSRDVALREEAELDIEYRFITPAGDVRWIHQICRPEFDKTGVAVSRISVMQDITKRKQAEQAMLESEQRYAALFEAAPLPMWVFLDDTDQYPLVAVNDSAVKEYGYSREEFLQMNALDMHPPGEFARLRKQLAGTATLRKASWNHRRKDGHVFPVDVVSKSIRYAGKSARFVTALDLTAQREAEATVQEHLFTLQRAADAATAITWHQTLDGMMQEFADQARGVIGAEQAFVSLSDGDAARTSTIALSVSESHAAVWNVQKLSDFASLFEPLLASGRAMRLTASDVELLRAQKINEGAASGAVEMLPPMRGCMMVPLLGRTGKNIGLLQLSDKYEGEFTQQDEYVAMELARLAAVGMENVQLIEEVNQLNSHLEQKVADRTAALTRQEALFRALAQQAPQVVWTANRYGQVTYLNRAWFDLVGGELESWSGTQWYAAMHPDDLPDMQANWKQASKSRQSFAGVRRVLARDGSLHTMSYRASPVFNAQGAVSFWVGIDADITEMKAIEAELRLSNQELEAFSYSVSHDLRSPLNTIDGFSRLLAKQINADSGVRAMHYLSRIHAGVAQMSQLIEDMLSLAQVSRVQLRHELIDLSALAEKSVEALRVRDPEREVSVQIDSGLHAFGDSRLVSAVMENLLGNAWKFSSQRADASIFVGQITDPAGQVSFFVRDNGAGFDMAYADKLFRAFQRLHTAAEFPGSGIGLATVNRIIARHGGSLWAQSSLGQGASFFFTLPKSPSPV